MVEIPDRIGRYKVETVIGAGGFATVYRAHDERLDAVVAVKVLGDNHVHDPDVRERFLKEGRVLRRIGSPHVVAVHDLGETDRGQPYLVLDYADRGDLAQRTRARRRAGWRPAVADLLPVSEAVADALTAVHASDLVHRDVAPRNMLLRSTRANGHRQGVDLGGRLMAPDERLLLSDLGLSKDLAAASGLTVGGGTAGFTPPEQRSGLTRVSSAADIWAASALLVWLLLEHPPDDEGRWRYELVSAGWPDALARELGRGLEITPSARHAVPVAWFNAVREAVLPPAPPPASEPVRAPGGLPATVVDPTGPRAATVVAPPSPSPVPTGPAGTVVAPAARRSSGARWVLGLVLAAAVGIAVGFGIGLLVDDGGDDGSPAVSRLDDGRVRVEQSRGDLSVAIIGPEEVPVSETATFSSDTSADVVSSFWIGPDGNTPSDPGLRVTADSSGRSTVTFIGTDREGRWVSATHEFSFVE